MRRFFHSLLPAMTMLAAAGAPAASQGPAPTERVAPRSTALRRALDDTLRRVLDAAVRDRAFPGAFAVVGDHAGILASYGAGHLDWTHTPRPDLHSMWDLASLTKVIGMTSAMMQLVEQGKVSLDAPVQRYLPEWRGPRKAEVTVRMLLTHTSGLSAFRAYDQITTNADSIAALMMAEPLEAAPDTRYVYSDIGAWLAGKIVERVSGERLDRYLAEHVFGPLGMHDTMYNPPDSLRPRIAPTEVDPRRGGKLWGKVHDERAYYLGGISAHAGLFSSGYDLARFAEMYLNGGALGSVRLFRPQTVIAFTTRQDTALSNRALGWEKPDGTNSAGHRMSASAFGHTGFTGTSIWIDPAQDRFIVLLTNRVDPTRNNRKIGAVRVALADALGEAFARDAAAPAQGEAGAPARRRH
ncbi:MAG TPA: serine hydrolase domain-containing protein [Gemmatimonadaceae bacterium]|nr:serine hydrolase domain-containing protein [Gemmatimonadaceae bacterium]